MKVEDYLRPRRRQRCKKCKENAIINGLCCSHFLREHRKSLKKSAKSSLMVG